MTAITDPPAEAVAAPGPGFEHTPVKHHPHRWRLARAGFVNVWHYYDTTFDASGGRFILRGTNGSGKSRALEMLLPFLLDADRRNMGTGTAVKMEDLMSAGALDQGNRVGYMWLELRRDDSDSGAPQWLTLGALVKFAASTKEAAVQYFTTPLRVHHELQLIGADREPLGRRELAELIGDDRITASPERHRERVRAEVFGLTGDLGKDRFDGLLKLLHTLRSPDVGNRIEEGKLPVILADALPPLSDAALTEAGAQLDGLTSTRHDQERLAANLELVRAFYGTYRSYIAGVLAASANSVRSAADDAEEAIETRRRAEERTRRLDNQRTELDRQQSDAAIRASGLRSELEALHASTAYRNARELLERAETVNSLAANADSVLASAATARAAERARAGEADRAASDVQNDAGALDRALQQARQTLTKMRLGAALPATVACRRDTPRAETDSVRTEREGDPVIVQRPTADRISFGVDLSAVAEALETARRAAASRRSQAVERRRDAVEVEKLAGQVTRARDEAERQARTADEARRVADQRVGERDQQALTLAAAWADWVEQAAADNLSELDPHFDPAAHPSLGQLLERTDVLCGPADDDTAALIDGLDGAAREVTARASEVIAERVADLKVADRQDGERRDALTGERAELAAARDRNPPLPPWQSDTGGLPLWRCLDFAEHVPADDRAGIEAALAATGLLTATVEPTGLVVAADGQVLLTAAVGTRAEQGALTDAVTVDSAGATEPALAAAVRAVLATVQLTDTVTDTSPGQVCVGRDGSWANGSLRGRHHSDVARHIGAAARAAARAQRIAEIDTELQQLTTAARQRAETRADLTGRRTNISALVSGAPSSRPLVQARTRAEAADESALKAADDAEQVRRRADELAVRYTTQEREHRARCEQFLLPSASAELREVEDAAAEAERRCGTSAGALRTLRSALDRHDGHLATLAELTGACAAAETLADQAWKSWHGPALELATLQQTVGAEAEAIQARITDAETERGEAERSARELQSKLVEVGRQFGEADTLARGAAGAVDSTRTELASRVQQLLDQLAEPGVAAAAFAGIDPVADRFTDLTPATVRTDLAALTGALRRTRSDQTALMRARQDFERDVTAYDVNGEHSASGVWLFRLADNEGRRPLADAATELAVKVEQGKAALSQREQEVFTRFVLGEVGEELRARINQASELVKAMNDSLREIRTSHNIGVKLAWSLAEDASGDIAHIKSLIARAAALRTEQQDRELTALLTARVQAESTANPTDGYAAHLRAALDYRAWHQIEVTITGPEQGRTRWLSRRAKLSQGETRFVSYVTLFAAADAYLSGLDDGTALRLILLDDAFAKVDDPTIAELLGLLVRLDLDFVMTGHALYGCYPQVPSLDVYEICREDGSPAATAHIHWDGRTRHLRPA